MATSAQRLFARWRSSLLRHRHRQHLLATLLGLWLGSFTLWHYRAAVRTAAAGTGRKTAVHETVDRWHLDDERLPLLNSMRDSRWLSYPEEELFSWTEPAAIEPDVPGAPGNLGSPVSLPPELEKEARRRNGLHQLNVVASDLIPVNRTLGDYRNPQCLSLSYSRLLPRFSLVIVFHNEAASTLLRTAAAAANRAPPQLLREVILVDDDSDLPDLTSPTLETRLRSLLPSGSSSRVVRTGSRVGLIRARLIGARAASGPVLVFLDAHVEASPGWAVPLLAELAGDRSRVALPVIDTISDRHFGYAPQPDDHERGGMDWKMMHFWVGARGARGLAGKKQEDTDAFPSATMIGCAFAVDREFFYASGSYDDEMKIWGGENMEMSVRIWRCGGSLLKVPCSRVGHVYRQLSPHSLPTDGSAVGRMRAKADNVVVNTARFAEAWLDQPYRSFYYYMNPAAKNVNLGPELSERKRLSGELKCHSFRWFLDHVFPDGGFPRPNEDLYFGQVQEWQSALCLDAQSTLGSAGMKQCHGLGGYQSILLTAKGEIRSAARCLEPEEDGEGTSANWNATFVVCNGGESQKWRFGSEEEDKSLGRLVHVQSGRCLAFQSKEASSRRPKMVLKYLANLVHDLAREVEAPVLTTCSGERGGGGGQVWVLGEKAQWEGHGNLVQDKGLV